MPGALRTVSLLLLAICALALAMASTAQAATTRLYQSSFGAVESGPQDLAVDRATGDVYVVGKSGGVVSRFTSAGAPKNFTAGPNAGTNTLTVSSIAVTVDNSGGPFNGRIYVAEPESSVPGGSPGRIKVFASNGESVGEIEGTGIDGIKGFSNEMDAIAVDQANGDLYALARGRGAPGTAFPWRIWRYRPSSPSGSIGDSDYELTAITPNSTPANIAAYAGRVYVTKSEGASLVRYSATDFTSNFATQPAAVPVYSGREDFGVSDVAVDPVNGDLYVDEGNRIAVLDSSEQLQYRFGFSAYFGSNSTAVAVGSATSGPASKAYVADRSMGEDVDIFGPLALAARLSHTELAAFGADGTAASQLTPNSPGQLAFDQVQRRIFAVDLGFTGAPGILGFDALSSPAYAPLTAFAPLSTDAADRRSGLAIDNTALASAGRIYFAPRSDLLYGWAPDGTPLGGAFPIDPASNPGGAGGSPKDLCGVAADSQGNVWVANSATKQVLKYNSNGTYLESVDTSTQGAPCAIALNSNDDLYAGIERNGVWKYTAASGYATATRIVAARSPELVSGIAVDPVTEHLYVDYWGLECATSLGCYMAWVDEYDAAGALLDELSLPAAIPGGVSVDSSTHDIYIGDRVARQVRVFSAGVVLPEPSVLFATAPTNTSATLNGRIVSQGVTVTDCHFEYVSEDAFEQTGFTDLSSGGTAPCSPAAGSIPLDLAEHSVSATATGLDTDTVYRFRLVAANANGAARSADAGFASAGPPRVETTGSPVRTATTAQLLGRVDPVRAPTTYRFEYGMEGPCDSNPCLSTADQPAGSGDEFELVAQGIAGLTPDTIYHYRIVADNGNLDGPRYGEDMTVRTRASDAPLSHGRFPGPPGSDRAWEQVNMADTNGNPVLPANGLSFSTDGRRAVFGIFGGTSIGESGSLFSLYFSERPSGDHPQAGWQSLLITPPREELVGPAWSSVFASPDLSSVVGVNAINDNGPWGIWSFSPERAPSKLAQLEAPESINRVRALGVSADDASRVVASIEGGTPDPAYPAAGAAGNLYDVSDGSPRLVSLLPGNTVASCGVFGGVMDERTHWVSTDGSRVFFSSAGDSNCGAGLYRLYARDLVAESTTLVSGPVVSGPECSARLIRSVPGAAFFLTASRLTAEDQAGGCGQNQDDIYRYDFGGDPLECVTCFAPNLSTEVRGGPEPSNSIAVSDDGARIYFLAGARLLPGVPENAIYRVDVGSKDLAYVGPAANLGFASSAVSSDGRFLAFSSSKAALNPLGGTDNGGTEQFYVYDDADRSLSCVSCPLDGSPALASAGELQPPTGPNTTVLANDGTFAFATPEPLVRADQNTPSGSDRRLGTDAYEWRDGQQLLVTDGLTRWTVTDGSRLTPGVAGITPSGRDIFFVAPVAYTLDALDSFPRLYNARIGGGIDFPPTPKPCPLEVCQGTPKGAPEEQAPGTSSFAGAANQPSAPARCRKGKIRRKGRCISRHKRNSRQRANHDRRPRR
jgi:hypothetical protein